MLRLAMAREAKVARAIAEAMAARQRALPMSMLAEAPSSAGAARSVSIRLEMVAVAETAEKEETALAAMHLAAAH